MTAPRFTGSQSGDELDRKVTLLAVEANCHSAVDSRITAFRSGLTRRGWDVDHVGITRATTSAIDRVLDFLPAPVRRICEAAGFEGDILPRTGFQARALLRTVNRGIAIVSVPPFSLLWAAVKSLPPQVPLIIDYRDPWSARLSPPPLARATRWAERKALRRASAMTYAGAPIFGWLLYELSGLAPEDIVSVPNGFDPADLKDTPSWSATNRLDGRPLDLVFDGYWYGRNGPGILVDALAQVGASIANLSIIGRMASSIEQQFQRRLGRVPDQHDPVDKGALYRRLAIADAAVITLDHASAVESRIPAKCYDYLAVGVPVIAVCPPDAAILRMQTADRFHHFDHRDADGLAAFLRHAAARRSLLRHGASGTGPTRDHGARVLAAMLERIAHTQRQAR